MTSGAPISHIQVEGRTLNAAICAAFLSWAGPRLGCTVSADLPKADEHPSGGPAIFGPQSQALCRKMGLDERDIIKTCAGTFAVGTQITLPDAEVTTFYPFCAAAGAVDGVAFHQIWHQAGKPQPYEAYFAPTHMAEHDRFAHPASGQSFRYNLVLDAGLLANYFSRAARHYGLKDAKGHRPDLLIHAGSDTHPGATAGDQTQKSACPSQTELSWTNGKLVQSASTQLGTFTFAYEKQASEQAGASSFWADDAIDMRGALSRLHPFDHCEFDALAFALQSLLDVWPSGPDPSPNQREFNRRLGSFADRAYDYQSALYLAAGQIQPENLSEPLRTKWTQFTARGRLVSYDEEPVSDAEWIAYMLAMNVIPERIDPLAGRFSGDQLENILARAKEAAQSAAQPLPPQLEYLQRAGAIHNSQVQTR